MIGRYVDSAFSDALKDGEFKAMIGIFGTVIAFLVSIIIMFVVDEATGSYMTDPQFFRNCVKISVLLPLWAFVVHPLVCRIYRKYGLDKEERAIKAIWKSLSKEAKEQFPDFESMFKRMHKNRQITRVYGGPTTSEGYRLFVGLQKVHAAEESRRIEYLKALESDRLDEIEADLAAFAERADAEAEIIRSV